MDGITTTINGRVGTPPKRHTSSDGRDRAVFRLAVNGIEHRSADRPDEPRTVWCECVYFPREMPDDRVDPLLEALLLKVDTGDAITVEGRITRVEIRAQDQLNLRIRAHSISVPVTSAVLPERP